MNKQTESNWNDEKLILLFYGELSEAESEACLQAMEENPALRQQYAELCQFLDSSIEIDIPEPSSQFDQKIMAAVYQQEALKLQEGQLQKAQQQSNERSKENQATLAESSSWLAWLPRLNIAVGAVAIVMMAISVFYIGRWSAQIDTPQVAEQTNSSSDEMGFTESASQKVLYSNLSRHLENSNRLFTLVSNGNGELAEQLQARQQMIEELVALNRLYRRIAEHSNDKVLVGTLQQMESILLELNNIRTEKEDQDSYVELQSIKSRIEESDLLFKLKVTNKNVENKII